MIAVQLDFAAQKPDWRGEGTRVFVSLNEREKQKRLAFASTRQGGQLLCNYLPPVCPGLYLRPTVLVCVSFLHLSWSFPKIAGLRRAEMAILNLADYVRKHQTLTVRGKRNKTRVIPSVE
jgi:hypothetical protein